MTDLLSILLQQQDRSRGESNPTNGDGNADGNDATIHPHHSMPQAAEPQQHRSRWPVPRHEASPAPAAPPSRGSRSRYVPVQAAADPQATPRLRVTFDRTPAKSLNEIANDPYPQPQHPRSPLSSAAVSRLVVYPVLGLGIAVALYVAWSQLGVGRNSGGGVSLQSGANGAGTGQPNNPAIAGLNGGVEDGGAKDPKNPAEAGKADGSAHSDSAHKQADAAKKDGAPKSGAGPEPAPFNPNAHVIRAISYADNNDGLEKAKSTIAELQRRGFADARIARVPKTKGGKQMEHVVLVGIGESARDPDLASTIDRLTKLPGFGAGQSKQRPFADAYLIPQPEADRASASTH